MFVSKLDVLIYIYILLLLHYQVHLFTFDSVIIII